MLLISYNKIACGFRCWSEEFFGSSGFEPCSEADHGFGVFFAQPVLRIAFDSKVSDTLYGVFNVVAANWHLLAA